MVWSEWVLAITGASVLLVAAASLGWMALNKLGREFTFLWNVFAWVMAGKPKVERDGNNEES